MDLQEVARRARVPIRRARYVIDHGVLPGLRPGLASGRAGRPRTMTAVDGFWVAAAALLLDGGVQRRLVTGLLDWLADTPWPPPGVELPPPTQYERIKGRGATVLQALDPRRGGPAAVEVGDGGALRVWVAKTDSGWFAPRPRPGARLDAAYAPRVTFRLDLTALREAWAGADWSEKV